MDTFRGVKNTPDDQINFLKDDRNEELREKFYSDVNRFINVFATCLSLPDFNAHFGPDELKKMSLEIKRFAELKKSTRLAMGQEVDFSKYRDQLHKILNQYVMANGIEELSKEINLSDVREFNQFVDDQKNGMSDRSKAEAIAAQTTRIIKERYNQDKEFYKRFSERIDKLLADLRAAKQEDVANLFNQMREIQHLVDVYDSSDIPEGIRDNKIYHPFYRNLRADLGSNDDQVAQIVGDVVEIIRKNLCVDWDRNITVQRTIMDQIDDYLYDHVRDVLGLSINAEQIRAITQTAWDLAVENKDTL